MRGPDSDDAWAYRHYLMECAAASEAEISQLRQALTLSRGTPPDDQLLERAVAWLENRRHDALEVAAVLRGDAALEADESEFEVVVTPKTAMALPVIAQHIHVDTAC